MRGGCRGVTSLLTPDVTAAPPHSLLQRPHTALAGLGLPRGLGPVPATGVRGGSAPTHAAPSSSSCRCCCGARPTTTAPALGTCSRRSPVSFRERGGREPGQGVPRDKKGIPGQGELPGAAPGRGGRWRPAGLVGTVGPGWDPADGLNCWHSGGCCSLRARLDP